MKFVVLLAMAVYAWPQGGVERPGLGEMIDGQNLLRPVYGSGGAFHVEAPIAEKVLSSSCSAALCLAKTDTALFSGHTSTPAPSGDAEIAIDSSGASPGATIYFPSVQQFGRWQNGSLSVMDLAVDGTVLSVGSGSFGLTMAVERAGTVWIVTSNGVNPDGTILDSLPLGAGAVLLTANGVVYATANSLFLRRSDGSETAFSAAGVTSLAILGDGYVEARAAGVLYALRTIPGREQLFQLPQPHSEPTKEPRR